MPLLAAVHQLVDVGGVGDLGALRDLPVQGGGEVAQDLDLEEAGVAGAVPVDGSRVFGHGVLDVAPQDVRAVASGAREPVTTGKPGLPDIGDPLAVLQARDAVRDHGMDTQDLEFKSFAKRVESSYVVTATYV